MSKPKKQKWIEYLFSCLNAEPEMAPYTWEFQYIADKFATGKLTDDEAMIQLQNLKKLILPKCKYQHHAEKILDGTIQFCLKPDFEY